MFWITAFCFALLAEVVSGPNSALVDSQLIPIAYTSVPVSQWDTSRWTPVSVCSHFNEASHGPPELVHVLHCRIRAYVCTECKSMQDLAFGMDTDMSSSKTQVVSLLGKVLFHSKGGIYFAPIITFISAG